MACRTTRTRLCRNAADRPRLLQIAAFSETLILDEDGLYRIPVNLIADSA